MNCIILMDGVGTNYYYNLPEARRLCIEAIKNGCDDAHVYRYNVKTGESSMYEAYYPDEFGDSEYIMHEYHEECNARMSGKYTEEELEEMFD